MLRQLIVACVTVVVLTPISACDIERPANSEANVDRLDSQVDAILDSYVDGTGPGYAVGIIQQGELVVAKGYGFANLANQQPITADSAMNLASLSKQFTGAAIALELGREKIALEDPLSQRWPGLPDFLNEVQIDHLLYMTSGIREYYSLPSPKGGWSSEDRFTVNDAISAVFESGSLEYTPGSRWSYSNINYQLLAELIAKLSDQQFSDYLKTNFFEPLHMTHSWVDEPLRTAVTYKAKSYVRENTGEWREAPRLSPHFGGSGIFASINDLYKWDEALYRGDTFGPDFRRQMLSTRQFDHDKDNDAFGLVHGTHSDNRTIWYEGGDYGVSTYMAHLPDLDATVICLANFADGNCGEVGAKLIDLVI